MPRKDKSIPVLTLPAEFGAGVFISRASVDGGSEFEALQRAHRDNWHSFFLQEQGTTAIEIDFTLHEVPALAVVYIHPSQVHRLVTFHNATICSWMIATESLRPECLKLLEDIAPAQVLSLPPAAFSLLVDTAALGIRFAARKQEKRYGSLLKDIGNTLAALTAAQYVDQAAATSSFSRAGLIAREFRAALEAGFATVKSPGAYAAQLHLTPAYLNECVKSATGYSVSHHIQQRIVLEAKRLLYHSAKSGKEIAAELGYDDYAYFVRLFGKVAGLTPAAFRAKNRD